MSNQTTKMTGRMKYTQRKGKGLPKQLESINVHAAGIDIGAEMHFAAVPPREGEDEAVRSFGCFTADLHALADWFEECGVETVAMESTGVYWMPVYRVLESRGFEVLLVNARHIKYVPGRKTDVVDCQWIQTLHAYGLLRGSFVPSKNIDQLRAYWRQRKMLVESCSREVQHMQKALTQMNLHLPVVLSDVTGVTGMKIIRAMVQGERDPRTLARFRHGGVKKSEEEIVKALTGHYSDEHLFCLRQALELYDTFQKSIADCDAELQKHMARFERKEPQAPLDEEGHKKRKIKKRANEPAFDLRAEVHRIYGVDLTRIDGIEAMTAQTILSECGPDLSQFPTARHFASWLGLCPNNQITGGKVQKRHSRSVKNRAATALRMAAQSLHRSQSYLGAQYRRKRTKLGAPKAITAMAHKLAKLIYAMIRHGQAYVDYGQQKEEQHHIERTKRHLIRQAKKIGYELLDIETGELVS